MGVRTERAFSKSDYYDVNLRKGLWNRYILLLGAVAHSVERGIYLWGRYRRLMMDRQKGRLSPADVAELTAETTAETGDYAHRALVLPTEEELARTSHMGQKGIAFAWEFLRNHPDVKSLVNIGARVDVVSAFCAPRFPNVTFTSIDFQPELTLHNSTLPQQPNWKFHPGYALEIFEKGDVRADAAFMTSTSVCFNNAELNLYLDAFVKCGIKYVVLNEPWWPKPSSLNPFKLTMPEDVAPEHPYITGWIGNYAHNYPSKLEQRGYRLTTSRLISGGAGYYALQIIARNDSL